MSFNLVYQSWQAILELTSKLEVSQRDQYAADTLAAQIRSMLLDQEHKRGRPYYEAETVQRQSSSLLAHSLERCIQELETKAEAKNQRLDEVIQIIIVSQWNHVMM